MRMSFKAPASLLLIIGVFALGQCSDNVLAPFQPEVTSVTDNFQLQATGVNNRSATLNYSWENTGAQAKINHSTTTTVGTARLIILDSGGAQVYEEMLVPSLTDTTTAGTPGIWTIRLVLSQYGGTLNFRAQKI